MADSLFDEFGSLISELSDLLSSMSAFLGFASALFTWAPGIGQGLAVAALVTAGGAAAVKTGLYFSGAKDEYGRPYVDRAELTGAFVDVAIEGAGVALGAAAKSMSKSVTIGEAMAKEFDIARNLTKLGKSATSVGDLGIKQAAVGMLKEFTTEWGKRGILEGGATAAVIAVVLDEPAVSPALKGERVDWGQISGWYGTVKLWDSGWDQVVNQPDPDAVKPVMGQ
jgi:hypothetical protein